MQKHQLEFLYFLPEIQRICKADQEFYLRPLKVSKNSCDCNNMSSSTGSENDKSLFFREHSLSNVQLINFNSGRTLIKPPIKRLTEVHVFGTE